MNFKRVDLDHVDKTLRENADELRRIGELEGLEQQGYASAPILVAASGLPQEEVLKRLVQRGSGDVTDDDLHRTIGVIRWLIDNR